MLGAANTGSMDIMSLFDVILIIYGIYSLSAAVKMKKEGQPPQWLVNQQEQVRMRNPREFCEYMAPKTIIFGILCALYGAYGLVITFFLQSRLAEGIGIGAFIICIIWFVLVLSKAKKNYM